MLCPVNVAVCGIPVAGKGQSILAVQQLYPGLEVDVFMGVIHAHRNIGLHAPQEIHDFNKPLEIDNGIMVELNAQQVFYNTHDHICTAVHIGSVDPVIAPVQGDSCVPGNGKEV